MFARTLVTGVRSSCDASATSWRWAPADLEAVDVRHQHVEHHDVGRRERQAVERAAAVLGHLDLVVEPQRPFERRPHRGLVVDDQDARHRRIVGVPPLRRLSSATI
jgi:hypothetical protein